MRAMSDTEKAYIAAMIDAEGTISLGRRRGQGKRSINGQVWHITIRVLVTNSHLGMIQYLHDASGVGIVYHQKRSHNPRWNLVHRWQVAAKQARELLREVRPYLIVKADLADLIVNMPMQPRGTFVPEVHEQQMRCLEQSHQMNQRGVSSELLS